MEKYYFGVILALDYLNIIFNRLLNPPEISFLVAGNGELLALMIESFIAFKLFDFPN
jgi:hypothetical protein